MASPAEQVFGTVELLEMILSQLPPRDILLSQRVVKQWQAVISSSNQLQTLLFFKPLLIDGDSPIWLRESLGSQQSLAINLNPQGPPAMNSVRGSLLFASGRASESATSFKNPLVTPLLDVLATARFSYNSSLLEALPPAWKQPNASWRNMLLTQPRVAGAFVWQEQTRLEWSSFSSGLMFRFSRTIGKNKSGFVETCLGAKRLGTILDELERDITSQKGEEVGITHPFLFELKELKNNKQLWNIWIEREYNFAERGEHEDVEGQE